MNVTFKDKQKVDFSCFVDMVNFPKDSHLWVGQNKRSGLAMLNGCMISKLAKLCNYASFTLRQLYSVFT